jgi:hypothetical protein
MERTSRCRPEGASPGAAHRGLERASGIIILHM